MRCGAALRPLAAAVDVFKREIDAGALWGTKLLFGLTTLVFLGQLAANRRMLEQAPIAGVVLGGLSEMARFGAMSETLAAVRAEPLRLLSAVFVHFNGLHFAFNMLALAGFGRVAERGVGTARFVIAYLVSGVVGFAAGVAVNELFGWTSFTGGASGAVFGMNGLILGWLFRTRDTRWGGIDKRWRWYALTTALYALLINLFPIKVNNSAHVGGLFCGAALGFYYAARPRKGSFLVPNLGALVGLVLAVASFVMAQRAAGWGTRPDPRDVPSPLQGQDGPPEPEIEPDDMN